MARGRRAAEWARAGQVAAMIFNVNRKRGASPLKAEDFYREIDPAEPKNAEFRAFVERTHNHAK
jgi:hypothetical protein